MKTYVVRLQTVILIIREIQDISCQDTENEVHIEFYQRKKGDKTKGQVSLILVS